MKCAWYSHSARKWKTTELWAIPTRREFLFSKGRGLSGKYLAILNISRTGHVALINLAATQRRLYCTSVNSHSPMGLVSWQWDTADWACVLCDRRIDNDQASGLAHHDNTSDHSTALIQAFLAKHHITQVCQPPYSPDLSPCDFWLFPKLKLPLKGRRSVNAMVTLYTSSVKGISLPND
jgi:hypothetical protein